MAFPFLPKNSRSGDMRSASPASTYAPSPPTPITSRRKIAVHLLCASGSRLPSAQATSAVSAEAASIFPRSGSMRRSPRRRILRRSRQNSASMPPVPEMVVASARPRTPIRGCSTLLSATFAATMHTDTIMVVRVSCMAWNVRLSKSRRPNPSTPMT